MSRVLAAAVLLAIATPAVAGPCLVHGLDPMIVTPAGTDVDQFGGIVVVATESLRKDAPHANVAVQPYELVSGQKRGKAVVTELAPGLAIYAPPQGITGSVDLEDTKGHSAIRVKFYFRPVRDLPTSPAPEVVSIKHTTNVPMFRTESTSATLKAAPPADAVALLVREAGSTAKLARSWVLVRDVKGTRIEIYMRDRCRPEVPGTIATRTGDRVELAWVDAAGRVSMWSAPVTVTTYKP